MDDQPAQPDLTRRTVVKGAAWSLPVLAVAVAAPAATASTQVIFDFDGACATQSVNNFHGPAFRFAASGLGVPAGTTIVVTGPGVATAAWNLNTLWPAGFPVGTVSGAPSGETFVLTFNTSWVGGPVVFGAPMDLPTLTRFDAMIQLPPGYTPAPQADSLAWISVSNDATACMTDFSAPPPP